MIKFLCKKCKHSIATDDRTTYLCTEKRIVDLYNKNNNTKWNCINEETANEYFPNGCPLKEESK